MTSLLRKAGDRQGSNSSYRTAVVLKLAAFVLALAAFFSLTALLSRPKPMKDLSEGLLPLTCATRDKELQRELIALHAAQALPKQRAEVRSSNSRRLCETLEALLSGADYQRLKTDLDQFSSSIVSRSGQPLTQQGGLQKAIDLVHQSKGQFDTSFDLKALQTKLSQAFAYGANSPTAVSLEYLDLDDGASPFPELQDILAAKFTIQLACGEPQDALSTLDLMFKLSNCVMNSDEPDFGLFEIPISLMVQSLRANVWRNEQELQALRSIIAQQTGYQAKYRKLLDFEREKTLLSFERVRNIHNKKPAGLFKALKAYWKGVFDYDLDADEIQTLKFFTSLYSAGPLPYYKSVPLLAPKKEDAPLMARTKATLLQSFRRQSEAQAQLEAGDLLLTMRLGIDSGSRATLISPLSGHGYSVLKSKGHVKVGYGSVDTDSIEL